MDTSNDKICPILQFFFGKGENTNQAAENVKSFYGTITVTVYVAQKNILELVSGNYYLFLSIVNDYAVGKFA